MARSVKTGPRATRRGTTVAKTAAAITICALIVLSLCRLGLAAREGAPNGTIGSGAGRSVARSSMAAYTAIAGGIDYVAALVSPAGRPAEGRSAARAERAAVDTDPPTGTLVVNGGAAYARSTGVTLESSVTGAVQMRFRNAFQDWGRVAAVRRRRVLDTQPR
jgi:hypothetical protein